MQVEDITRIGLTSWRPSQQQGYLTIGPGLFGQIIIDNQGIFATITKVFAHGTTGIRRDVLHSGRVRRGSSNNNGVFHRAMFFQLAYHGANGRGFLTNGHIDTFNTGTFLIDDGIDGNRCFTGLSVTDNQFALTTADRHHGVDGFQTGLYGLRH